MGRHPPCDAPIENTDSALFEGIGSSVPRLYHRKELTNVHAKWVVIIIFRWFLSSVFYGRSSHHEQGIYVWRQQVSSHKLNHSLIHPQQKAQYVIIS